MFVLLPNQVFDPGAVTLHNRRKKRYLGEDLCLAMSRFSRDDERRIRELYAFLQSIFEPLKTAANHKVGLPPGIEAFLAAQDMMGIIDTVHTLGVESLSADASEIMAKTVHDVRGGALTALMGRLQLAQLGEVSAQDARQIFFLTRDHLKIMRNALIGLDDAKREADLQTQLHGTDLLVEKWEHALLPARNRDDVHLKIECRYDGPIAECCVEFGAVDRILYNLVNNAARHTSDATVRISILQVPEEVGAPTNLRFIISNQVNQEEERQLVDRDLSGLFEPGVSSTGSGFGLTVVADFVGNAFGIQRQRAVHERYLGAALAEGGFHAWFHWPIVADV